MSATPPAEDPASLFLHYYAMAASWSGPERATAPEPAPPFATLAREILRDDDPLSASQRLALLVDGKSCAADARRGRVLAALRAIDLAFLAIHPRSLVGIAAPTPPNWLRDARFSRLRSGEYGRAGTNRLIARGPLLREPRHPHESSGDMLSDYFAALAVAPLTIAHDGRDIAIQIRVINHNALTGVPPASAPGRETVGFLPLAANRSDIDALTHDHAGKTFVRYGPSTSFDAAGAAIAGLRHVGPVDIAIMPELALGEADVDKIGLMLEREPTPLARLIVAGSYSTSLVGTSGQPWNECRVLNGLGVELWRQRKLWPAGVNQATAIKYGFDPGPDTLTLEDNAAGDELIVADVDGLGRCIVLICQDCEMPTMGPALLAHYQPDWVFTPIFDCTIDEGRWAHARAFALSSLSQARFLAITNMAFAGPGANMGLAVGPKEATGNDPNEVHRAFLIITRPTAGAAVAGKIQWRQGLWHQTLLGSKPAPMLGGP
jgi:hypothetical protein